MRSSAFLLVAAGLAAATVLLVRAVGGQESTPVDLILWGGTVVTVDAEHRVIPVGAIAIAGTRIVAVGTADEILTAYTAPDRIDTRGHILLPGLINAHTHAPMVLFRGMADDLSLMDWLERYIFPAEALTVSPDLVRIGTRLAALEMIQSGTTTFADMYYFEDDVAREVQAVGLRAVLGQTVIGFPVNDAGSPAEALARAETFIETWSSDPLITPAVAPHSAYTLDAGSIRAARELASRFDVPLLVHLAETQDEVRTVRAAHGRSPAAYLESLGAWSGRAIAAHGVWLDEADRALLSERGVGLAHNPESNMKLASGVADVPAWIREGLLAGLGTDGAASNNDLDMFEAMRFASLLHKISRMDPEVMPASLVLEMATRRGAEALGLGGRVGSLEAGKEADVIVVGLDGPRQTPMYDPVSHLVYVAHGEDVRHVIIGGRIVMRDRQVLTMNPGDVLRDAGAMAEQVRRTVAGAAATTDGR